jgi:hypothetical protein
MPLTAWERALLKQQKPIEPPEPEEEKDEEEDDSK